MRRRTSAAIYNEERKWFFAASGLLLSVCALYAYFVSLSVVHVVMRKEIDREKVELGSYVSQLESQYIDAQHAVSREIASHDGYKEADDKIFITRTRASLVLSGNNGS